MFAFALWDENKKQLFIARDRLGEKPLFYYYDQNRFLFASEIKAILAEPDIRKEINLEAIDSYLSLRFIYTPHTMYKNICKLPAAHSLILKNGKIQINQYWKPSFSDKISKTKEEIFDQLRDLFLDSINIRLMSDVPIGAFLSGGIDSSMVVSLMSQVSKVKPQTFSIGVVDNDYNELPYARAVADKYGTNHHEFIIRPDIVNILPKVIELMGEPTDPFAISVYNIAEVTRKHVTVALGGDGGDELFGGYDRYHGNNFVGFLSLLPNFLLQPFFKSLIKIVPEDFSKKSLSQKLRWLSHVSSYPENRRYFESMSFFRFTDLTKDHLYSQNLKENLNGSHPSNYILKYFNDDAAEDLVDHMMYTDLMTRLPDYTLQILDHMTMAHSLEGRSPFLDHRFVEFACSIPSSMKVSKRELKVLLKEFAKDYLPPQLLTREKQGFGFPLHRWLKNDLREMINDVLHCSKLVADGYFNDKYIQCIIGEHQKGAADHQMRIWSLLNMELWYSLVFNK
jgi:asparagine synthase (glutamine-hydrolysing)